jgi:hypothetical protein
MSFDLPSPPPAPVDHGDAGWTGAAIAVRSILQISTPLLLRLSPSNEEPLYIDFRHHAYTWTVPIARFPASAASVEVETEPAPPGSPPLFELPGQNLDNLLWAIGLHSFGGASASWLRAGERYRLTRWPNFTELPHTIDQMRMTSLLGNAYFSVAELAAAASTTEETATRLINALSLMNVLKDADVEAAPAPDVRTETTGETSSLFRRLRARLGL